MTQNEQIIQLLMEHPTGINREWVHEKHNIVDVPTRISDVRSYFKAKGFIIDKRTETNRTATYFLRDDPDFKKPIVTIQSAGHYCFRGNQGNWESYSLEDCQTCNPKPIQESLL